MTKSLTDNQTNTLKAVYRNCDKSTWGVANALGTSKRGRVYSTLRALERKGLVESDLLPEGDGYGRGVRYWDLTDDGLAALGKEW